MCLFIVRLKQRAVVGLEMFYGDNRDDTHMFQLIKAHDVAQHVRRQQVARFYRVAQNQILHQTICNIFATSGQILEILEAV